MELARFHYDLPPELIAQQPLADRAASRMLVVDRKTQRWEDHTFRELPGYLSQGDCLVLNNSRVFPSRLFGQREGRTGKIEVFLVKPVSSDNRKWEALVRPGRKVPVGETIYFDGGLKATAVERAEHGERILEFDCEGDFYSAVEKVGHVPLPPYIRRPDDAADRERYQTVFAKQVGSVAAPTAGLHFTPEVLNACRDAGADVATVTLHVGLGTFQPVHEENLKTLKLHTESFELSEETADKVRQAKRVVAVGTTSVRTLESCAASGSIEARRGETDIFITPGYEFRVVGAMLTNFHLPESSLMMLVCAFGGIDFMMEAYKYAVSQRYRFFSYGDCMLIL